MTNFPVPRHFEHVRSTAIGKMPCWQTWQGYVALLVVAPVAIAAGVPWLEVGVDCAELAAGFACARR